MTQKTISKLPHYDTNIIYKSSHDSLSPKNGENSLTFESAEHIRHKARLTGMNPNYWYPAEWSNKISPGKHSETKFWGDSIALFRSKGGEIAAIENRCAHRHLPLTMGKVEGCNLVCIYHGWAFDRNGELQSVEHDKFDRNLPKTKIRSYPVKERYGLIWIFPGDPVLADRIPLPLIPNAEGEEKWPHLSFDFSWKAHHSMVMDNICNLTHLYVHGKWVPYHKTWMSHDKLEGDAIEIVWSHTMRKSSILWPIYKAVFLLEGEENLSDTHDLYDYPYQVALQNKSVRTVNLMLPMSDSETRVFTIQYWKILDIPLLPKSISKFLMKAFLVPMIRPVTREVFRQDGATVEGEMSNLNANFFKPIPEINHSVRLFDKLNVERWQAWLDYCNGRFNEEASGRQKVLLDFPLDYKTRKQKFSSDTTA